MSITLLANHSLADERLDDIAGFAGGESLPAVPWLTQLDLDAPRTNLHCLSPGMRAAKRAVDIAGALLLLAVLWPVMLLTALMVKLTSPGPVIFRQTRVGLNLRAGDRRQDGFNPRAATPRAAAARVEPFEESAAAGSSARREPRPPGAACRDRRDRRDRRVQQAYGRHFVLYKFRSMRIDAERHGAQFAVKGDRRVTPIGRFLRLTRLDELPQLWNVLKGEMSLVGPRPERPEFIEELSEQIPDYLQRLGLKPGLTGVAQIVNGYDNDIESFRRKVAFDVLYLQNCSLWNDCKILLRTVRVVLTGSGAL